MNASKVIFVTFNLNYGLHTISVGKPSEDVKFLDGRDFLKPNPNQFSVSAHHYICFSRLITTD